MSRSLALVFRAHQPVVPAGDAEALEALVGAACTAYLPLLRTLARFAVEGWDAALGLAISPELVEALEADEHRDAISRGLTARIDAWRAEADSQPVTSAYREVAQAYADELELLERVFEAVDGRIAAGFESHRDEGRLELLDVPLGQPLLAVDSTGGGLAFGPEQGARGLVAPGLVYPSAHLAELQARGLRYALVDGRAVSARTPATPAVVGDGFVLLPADRDARARITGFLADPGIEGLRRTVSVKASLAAGARLAITEGALHARGRHRVPYRADRAVPVLASWAGDFAAGLRGEPGDGLCLVVLGLEELGARWYDGFTLVEALAAALQNGPSRLLGPAAWLGGLHEGEAAEPALRTDSADGFLGDWIGPETAWVLAGCHELAGAWRAAAPSLSAEQRDAVLRSLRAASDATWLHLLRQGERAAYAAARVRGHLDEGWACLRGVG